MSFTIFQNEKTPFQAINTTSSESQKIDIFPKGLTHGFGQKMAVFPTFPFQVIQARKMSFTIFYIEKTPFTPIKQKVLKVEKTEIFPRGLTNSFGPKLAIFPTFFFQAIQARKISFLRYTRPKQRLSRLKKQEVQKGRKIEIFPKALTHSYGPKLAILPNFFFRQYRPGKCLLRYSTKKKRLSRL